MLAVAGCLLLVYLGYLAATGLAPRLTPIERVDLGCCLGFGLLVPVMLTLSVLGIPYSLWSIYGAFALMVGLIRSGRRLAGGRGQVERQEKVDLRDKFRELCSWTGIFYGILGVVLLCHLILAWYYPSVLWDEVSRHYPAAQVIADAGTAKTRLLLTYAEYLHPLFLPLTRAFYLMLGGSWNTVMSSLIYAGFVILTADMLRRHAHGAAAFAFSITGVWQKFH